MNNKLIIGLGALAAAAIYFFKGKKEAIENIRLTPMDIAINKQKSTFMELYFNFKLKIANPSNFAVKINKIEFDIIINGRKISEFNKDNFTTIAPKDTGVITLEIAIGNLQVIDAVLNAIAEGGKINIQLQGMAETDLGAVYIDYKKQLNV